MTEIESADVSPLSNSLHGVAKSFERLDPKFSSTLFSFFTIDEKLRGRLEALGSMTISGAGHPCSAFVAQIKDRKFQRWDTILYGGVPVVSETKFRELEIKGAASYLVFCSPCVNEDGVSNENVAKHRITVFVGMVVAFLGKAATLSFLGDEIVTATEGKTTITSNAIRMPMPEDGASFNKSAILREVLDAISTLPVTEREPFLYAWEIFGRATQEDDETYRFTLYWIALEVVGKTKGDGLATKLANAYGMKKEFAYSKLEFRRVYDLRHNIVHKGGQANLDGRMERLLQSYFLELMRARLGLKCERLCEALIGALPEDRSG